MQHASSVVQLLYVVFVKSSNKLLNYFMLDPAFIEVKMETLKTLGEIPKLCRVIGERMEVTPMISLDPHKVFTVSVSHYFESYQI